MPPSQKSGVRSSSTRMAPSLSEMGGCGGGTGRRAGTEVKQETDRAARGTSDLCVLQGHVSTCEISGLWASMSVRLQCVCV